VHVCDKLHFRLTCEIVGRATVNGSETCAVCICLHPVSATRRQAQFP
jgi:hypothetical protein